MNKASKTLLDRDPDYFKKLGKKGAAARKNVVSYFHHLKNSDPDKLKELATKGGQKSKRGK